MQRISLFFTSLLLISAGLGCHSGTGSVVEQPPKAELTVVTDSVAATQTVLAFLSWYKAHIGTASQIQLVDQEPGKPYSVNLKNGERYLAYLRTSNLLTDSYLNEWRLFFRQRNEGFKANPEVEGPPTGFDYDLVLLNQDVDQQLDSLKSLKIEKVTVAGPRARVQFSLLGIYEFRLVRRNNHWLINEILNLNEE
ncbi:hypothetical protein [Spirosoma radiotolerans]|uniref:hypothetical protein n=1 Tax=Spirosoma radiotolerans TaxID=1379870 RepID=UPI000AA985C4|nr:hypothetical protein [Spirosoma radiotolerans]